MKKYPTNSVPIILSGPSGVGKGTLSKAILAADDNICLTTSVTTRNKRFGETEGKEYYFKTKEEFFNLVSENKFLEYVTVHNNHYGTLNSEVERLLSMGKDIIFEIDVQGGLNIKKQMPDCATIFIAPPDLAELRNRIELRGSETDADMEMRLNNGINELKEAYKYDYVIVNDDFNECVYKIRCIIESEKHKTLRNNGLIEKILKGANLV